MENVADLSHCGRCTLVVAGDVADDQYQGVVGQLEPVVPIPTDPGELHSRLVADGDAWPAGAYRERQEAALESLGHRPLHLGVLALRLTAADPLDGLAQRSGQQAKEAQVVLIGSQLHAE